MALYGLSYWAEEPGIQKAMLSLIKRICRDASVRNKMNAQMGNRYRSSEALYANGPMRSQTDMLCGASLRFGQMPRPVKSKFLR